MAAGITPLNRITQPGNGLARISTRVVKNLGLKSVWVGSNPGVVLLRNTLTTRTSSVSIISAAKGYAASFPILANQNVVLAADADSILGTTECTIAVLRRCRDTTPRATHLFAYNFAADNRCLSHAPYSDGNMYWDFGDATAGSGRVSVAYTKDTDWETLVFVAGQVVGREIWRRGIRIVSGAGTATRPATDQPFHLGAAATGADTDAVDVAMIVTSDRAWSPSQIQKWSFNPYGTIFEPVQRHVLLSDVIASAAATYRPTRTLTGVGY